MCFNVSFKVQLGRFGGFPSPALSLKHCRRASLDLESVLSRGVFAVGGARGVDAAMPRVRFMCPKLPKCPATSNPNRIRRPFTLHRLFLVMIMIIVLVSTNVTV